MTKMTLMLEEKILEEIVSEQSRSPKNWARTYFNNFYMHFPADGASPKSYEIMTADLWDVPYGEAAHSERKAKQTRREFYKTINDTIRELIRGKRLPRDAEEIGGQYLALMEDPNMVHDLVIKHDATVDERRDELHNAFCSLYLPIYIALREQGYAKEDLSS